MTLYNFSTLSDGQEIAFNPAADILRFDLSAFTAADVRLEDVVGGLAVTLGDRTVFLVGVRTDQLSIDNVTFANGSILAIGDGTEETIADAFGQSYDLRGTTVGHFLDGRGGADLVRGGAGDDWIVGNAAASPLAHVSSLGGTGAPTASNAPTISADGRFVAFFGGWTGFGSQSNSSTDVLIRDMVTGSVTNEHLTVSGNFGLSGSGRPVISADGNWLAFWSNSNLTEAVPAPSSAIYVGDTRSLDVELVSVSSGGAAANGPSDYPDISANGRYVVFESRATNLAAGGNATFEDIFLHDRLTDTTTRISTAIGGGDGNGLSQYAAISSNGRYVVFQSAATNLTATETGSGQSDIYLWDRNSGNLVNITGGVGGNASSRDADVAAGSAGGVAYGGVVVFETDKRLLAADTNNATDVYAYDIATGTFTIVSANAAGQEGNLSSGNAAISDDGRYVAFQSFATNLVGGDTNGFADVYVKDLLTGAIALVSRIPAAQANQTSGATLSISAGGDWIVFESSASNLAASDANGGLTDVFRVANPLLADTLRGGRGDDTYVLSRADVVVEAAAEGTDTVRAGFTYTLGANVENLVLTGTRNLNGTGNSGNNVITGNAGDNVLDGRAGRDTASYAGASGAVIVSLAAAGVQNTGDGADRLIGFENLTGSDFDDRLTGDGGDNVLNGGLGADTLAGGAGNDTYIVTSNTDIITGEAGGTDTVIASLTWTLQGFLENLTLTGNATNGTGNNAANLIRGNGRDNRLTGSAGNDTLDGGAGSDTLIGGTGNDTYVVDAATDITAGDTGGTDTVISAVNWTLQSFLENLTLSGTAANGTGNAADNVLTGNASANRLNGAGGDDALTGGAGNDTLTGASGADTLTGGAGSDELSGGTSGDVFVFTTVAESRPGAATRDVITGFEVSILEKIDLSAIDANTGVNGGQAFAFSGGPADHAVWFVDLGADVLIRADNNGDAIADLEIMVEGVNLLPSFSLIL